MINASPRQSAYEIDPLILERWSPRAFDSSAISDAELNSLFEAARWAPSAFNVQPWRFHYARRDTALFDRFLAGLIPFNQSWAKNASLLIYVLSDTLAPSKPGADPQVSHSHSFDAGAAWVLLALQATRLGLHAHAMSGIDLPKVREVLNVPAQFRIEAAIAVGRIGDKSVLPESLQAREAPSGRKPISEFVSEGGFAADALEPLASGE
jgi:nitroreductase